MQWVIKRHVGFIETKGIVSRWGHNNGMKKLCPEKAAHKMTYMNTFKICKKEGNIIQDKEII